MSHIYQWKVNEQHAEIFREVFDESLSDDRIAVVDVGEDVEARWVRDLSQFFLAHEHRGLQTRRVREVKQVSALSDSFFGKTGSNSVALIAASQVLYEIAQTKGDAADALHWYIRYADAEKGHLNDLSARALAYQQIHQQVQEKKAQLATLRQRNQVLELQRAVDRRSRTEIELAIALLLVLLGSIGLYALRTRRSQLKFQKLAQRDGLTGILNRQHFIDRARAELGYCAKSLREACLIAIDLDHFKQINDSHGHAAGDSALLAAVAACQRHLRSVDLFGRMGGEEFAILLPDTVPERAADLAEAMRAQIAALGDAPDGPGVPLSASFGIAAARVSGYELQHLLAHADGALYRAKREGRNRVVLHDPATDPGADGLPHGMADRRKATHS